MLGRGARLREEVFYLAYHLHWGWSEIMGLDTAERRTYVRMLAERVTAENQALDGIRDRIGIVR